MPELGETINIGTQAIDSAPSCDKQDKKDNYGWKARVNGLGQDKTKCSGQLLFESMESRKEEHFTKKSLGFVPKKEGNDHWAKGGLAVVDEKSFPLQAHHLIPKNFLPKHDVCVWLCKDFNKNKKCQLDEDTYYNTDHANNGYAMPDALRLKEWKEAKNAEEKCKVAFSVMKKTKVQLHQGSHADTLDLEKIRLYLKNGHLAPVAPVAKPGDAFEEDEIHDPGYLDPIEIWLNAAGKRISSHVTTCTKGCKKDDSGGKVKVRPLEASVRLMNQVSYIAKAFLCMNAIFACPYGAAYALQEGFLIWNSKDGRYHIPLSKEEVSANLSR